ncbi:MAG: hypothetical protein LBM73_01620 [Candidatus Nomurabacteria bacterium]|jgi:cytoskeletal protein RodZ|nr:hypothetical protein [Candidatus Nomurabacteria bacterium]
MHPQSNLSREQQTPGQKPPRKSRKLTVFLIILCIILLAAAITFAALYFFKPKTKTVVEAKTETSQTNSNEENAANNSNNNSTQTDQTQTNSQSSTLSDADYEQVVAAYKNSSDYADYASSTNTTIGRATLNGIENSSIAPYQTTEVEISQSSSSGDDAESSGFLGLFYRTSPSAKWQYLAGTQGMILCSAFSGNADAQKAFAGSECATSYDDSSQTYRVGDYFKLF